MLRELTCQIKINWAQMRSLPQFQTFIRRAIITQLVIQYLKTNFEAVANTILVYNVRQRRARCHMPCYFVGSAGYRKRFQKLFIRQLSTVNSWEAWDSMISKHIQTKFVEKCRYTTLKWMPMLVSRCKG